MQWNRWLSEKIHSGWGDFQSDGVARHIVLREFVINGLYPWVESMGYRWAVVPAVLASRIATGLYNNRNARHLLSEWRIAPENTDYSEEDSDHYSMILSQEAWARFWSVWGHWDDVSPDTERGIEHRYDIQEYVWTQLNLKQSRQTSILENLLGLSDEYYEELYGHSAAKQRSSDQYVKDAAESNEWGGIRK
jgi:hypothetical protein